MALSFTPNVAMSMLGAFKTIQRACCSSKTPEKVSAFLYNQRTTSQAPWSGGTVNDQIMFIPFTSFAVNFHAPFGTEAYKAKNMFIYPEPYSRPMGGTCHEGEDRRGIDIHITVLETASVLKSDVEELRSLHEKLVVLRQHQASIAKTIEYASQRFNLKCNQVRVQFKTEPTDPLIFPERVPIAVGPLPPCASPTTMPEYFGGSD